MSVLIDGIKSDELMHSLCVACKALSLYKEKCKADFESLKNTDLISVDEVDISEFYDDVLSEIVSARKVLRVIHNQLLISELRESLLDG